MLDPEEPQPRPPARRRERGRPRAFDREAALAQAMRLFWCKGYEAVSIADLTAAMGIASPSLYAAFGSKGGLYAEAVRLYADTYDGPAWAAFDAAPTALEAIAAYLATAAGALTGSLADTPRGCMVTLSAVGAEGHDALGELVRAERDGARRRLEARLHAAVAAGELPAATDVAGLARFVRSVHAGMSILARDGASRAELEGVARVAVAGLAAGTAG